MAVETLIAIFGQTEGVRRPDLAWLELEHSWHQAAGRDITTVPPSRHDPITVASDK
jgi:hypothetical protein